MSDVSRDATVNLLENAILDVLCYFGVFNYPISFYKLCMFLNISSDITVTDIARVLHGLVERNVVVEEYGRYLLKDIPAVAWQERATTSHEAIDLALCAVRYLKKIPWIKLFAVTGSTAAYNKTSEDDIDVFIVTQTNRLWLTRFFTYLILKLLDLYRTDAHSKDKLCTNLFVDESRSSWSQDQNIYIAHEIVTMLPLINKNNSYLEFLNKNVWVSSIFPNFKFFASPTDNVVVRNFPMDLLEKMVCKLQLTYMKPKRTVETVQSHVAHFNKSDSKDEILSKYFSLKAEYTLD
jgi:hypothetical protein